MSTIKLRRAAKLSRVSKYPRTWDAVMARIPDDVRSALNSRQIAAVADAMHAQYKAGHSAGYKDAK